MNRRIARLIAGVAITVGSLRAHHSISGAYDTNRQITVTGNVTLFQFVNPHPFLTVDAEDTGGERQTWRMEMDNRSE
jgi:hypothetical protein